ncbi:MAG: four helix bundle protein [Desulfobacterales bacterium]
MEDKIRNFKDLKIWQKSMELAKVIYQATDSFPAKETYGIISQMRRSAVSIPSNIAEGFMRRYNKEYKQFLYIALGSLAELETQLLLSKELGFMKKIESMDINANINELNKMITGLIKCL